MKVTRYQAIDKGSMIGKCSAIRNVEGYDEYCNDIVIMKNKDGHRFVSWPNRPYEQEGQKKYFKYMGGVTTTDRDGLDNKLFEALDEYIKSNAQQPDTDLPF